MATIKQITERLKSNKIQPSLQRIKILEYLENHPVHPTADAIYHDLKPEIPTLSRSTVYNTLDLLHHAGLIRIISIDQGEKRYDAVVADHGHFRCEICGRITNFAVEMDNIAPASLDGFLIQDKNIYFKGVCAPCLESNHQKRERRSPHE